jgi:cytidine diphosphoramidate kinase
MAKLIWITGLAGSGKTTIGSAVYTELKKTDNAVVFLDGDHFREINGNTLGYEREERLKVAYQISRMCKFLIDQNITVVCSTISLFKEIHQFNKLNFINYFEIFVECSMDELIRRDQKGIYTEAINGIRKNVVGVDMHFDIPKNCNLKIENSTKNNLDEKVIKILNLLN